MKAYIETKALRTVSMFQAVKDIRYYMNGVYVEYNEMETRVVATDGCCLGAYRIDARGENEASGNFIIPTDTVKQLLAWKTEYITVEPELTDSLWYSASCPGDRVVKFQAIDGKFPDYRRVMMRGPLSNEPAQFDAHLIDKFQKAAAALIDKDSIPVVTIGHNGDKGAPVSLNGDPDFAGVIMPWRGDESASSPEWAYSALPDLPAVKASEPAPETIGEVL